MDKSCPLCTPIVVRSLDVDKLFLDLNKMMKIFLVQKHHILVS